MAGHSKWANIKHKKAAQDAKRGKIFTKLIKEIIVAAKMGGGDPENNPRLRAAIALAKEHNMPKDNIERAIKKGTGEIESENYEEVIYEGYGPGGVALLVEVLTDNKNRTASAIRHIFTKHGGNLGEAGCVSWIFERKGIIQIEKEGVDFEKLFDDALGAGAEDIDESDEKVYEIITPPSDFESVRKTLEEAGYKIFHAKLTMIPKNTVKVDEENANKLITLMNKLEDNDDVQNVYSNFEMDDALLEKLSA